MRCRGSVQLNLGTKFEQSIIKNISIEFDVLQIKTERPTDQVYSRVDMVLKVLFLIYLRQYS